MKFVVSSIDLLNHLQALSRVISSKNTLPILDNFLFRLDGKVLEITASDLETTAITSLELENSSGSGSIAIPAKLLTDSLREFPDQPLTFTIDTETYAVTISSENGSPLSLASTVKLLRNRPGLSPNGVYPCNYLLHPW
jgi:DNA polymerase-3 subunit beta